MISLNKINKMRKLHKQKIFQIWLYAYQTKVEFFANFLNNYQNVTYRQF